MHEGLIPSLHTPSLTHIHTHKAARTNLEGGEELAEEGAGDGLGEVARVHHEVEELPALRQLQGQDDGGDLREEGWLGCWGEGRGVW